MKNLIKYAYETSRGHFVLNPVLIIAKGLKKKEVEHIIKLHTCKDLVLDQIEETLNRDLLKEIEMLEFQLQDAWKFPRNVNYHKFWEIPGCICPKLDNDDRYPHGYYVQTVACPLHGSQKSLEEKPRKLLTSGDPVVE